MQHILIYGSLSLCLLAIFALNYIYQKKCFTPLSMSIGAFVCFGYGLVQMLIFEPIMPYENPKIVFVLDVSKSMQAKDIFPSRLAMATKKLQILLKTYKPCSSIIIFAQNAYLLSPFSCDYLTQIQQLQKLNTNKLPWYDRVFENALDTGASNGDLALESAKLYGDKIIVLSDGEFIPRDSMLWVFATPQGSVIEIDSALLYDENHQIVQSTPLSQAITQGIMFSYSNKDIQKIASFLGKNIHNAPPTLHKLDSARISLILGLILLFISLYGATLRHRVYVHYAQEYK
ncbi:VWA domain-containing protein [Helicobacter equorum]|uniref:VWA domain-containing protein n=1 Tax=Helicobacter equorum TaxID=361872 RepID=UPI000CF038AE|nr:VWA domain-containing protein [Helicobacter equorum]